MKHQNSRFVQGSLHLAARLALVLSLVVVATGGLATPGQAAGMSTHQLLLYWAVDALDDKYDALATMLVNQKDAFYSGAIFPDWGYAADVNGCDHCGDLGEAAHWPPFMDAYINYMRPKFKDPSEDDKKAIAFLFGLIAHNSADIPFHFGDNAFLTQALANNESGANAYAGCLLAGITGHTCMELLVDELNLDRFGDWDENYLWYPTADLQAVYAQAGHTVTDADLLAGYNKQKELYGLENQAHNLFPTWLIFNVDWVKGNLDNHPDGGMNDMASHIAEEWQKTWDDMSTSRTYLPMVNR